MIRRRRRAVGLWLAALALAACGAPWPDDLEPVAHPDLAAAEPAVREQVSAAHGALTAMLERGRGDTSELVAAFGRLGETYHAYELYDAARACYANARRLAPGDAGWSHRIGLAAAAAGDFTAAAAALAEAHERGGDDPALRLRLAGVRLALGETAAARALAAPLADDPVYGAAARFTLGRAALTASEPTGAAEAVEHFQAVLAAQPQAGAARHTLAEARRRLGQQVAPAADEATDAGAGAAEPSYPDPLADRIADLARSSGAFLQRGNRALVAGRTGEAVAALRRAITLDPQSTAARRNLALALRRQGDVAGAVAELEAALAIAPDEAQTLFDLGNARLDQGDRAGAVEAFRETVARAPEMTRARFNLANVLGSLGRWQEAEGELRQVLARDPDDRRAAYLGAMAAHRLGRSEEATTRLEALLAADPADVTVRRGLVAVLGARGRRDRAAALVEEALAGDDLPAADRQGLLLDLAEAERIARRLNEALALAVRAVEVDPGHTAAWLAEAHLRFAAGDWHGARTRLEEALAHHPGHVELTHSLARLLATCPEDGLRDGARALTLARAVHGRAPSLDHALTVGMALAESGDLAGAVRWHRGLAEQARRLPATVQAQIAAQLRLFESGRPLRAGVAPSPPGR